MVLTFGFATRKSVQFFWFDQRERKKNNRPQKNKKEAGNGGGKRIPRSEFAVLLFNNSHGHRTPPYLKHTHIIIIAEGDNLIMEMGG